MHPRAPSYLCGNAALLHVTEVRSERRERNTITANSHFPDSAGPGWLSDCLAGPD